MTLELITALAAFAFVALITPGPNNLMLMASGLTYGWARTLPHMLGIGVGFPAMIILVGLGLMQIFEAVPYSYFALKIVGAGYLLYLAWKIATAEPRGVVSGRQSTKPFTFLQAAMFQWVNPKAWAMALTAVSLYTPPDRPLVSVVVVGLMFAAIGTVTISSWTFLGQQLRHFLNDPAKQRAFNVVCALALTLSLVPMLADG